MIERAIDGSAIDRTKFRAAVTELCDALEAIDADGWYSVIEVVRPWSRHNPHMTGEFARPRTIRWYLERELGALLELGATITVRASRPATPLDDPALLRALDEVAWEMRAKKLFLFAPERMALSMERLAHYCGTPAESFQRYVLFTNYAMHIEEFRARFPDAEGPEHPDVQMPAWHHRTPDQDGVSIVDIGVGPSNAKTVTDHLAVLRPDAMLMIGHCAGLRNHQDIGDYVLATAYLRDDRILDHALPTTIPVIPNHRLNSYLLNALDARRPATGSAPCSRPRTGIGSSRSRRWSTRSSSRAPSRSTWSRRPSPRTASATASRARRCCASPTSRCTARRSSPSRPSASTTRAGAHLEITLECIDRVRREHPAGIPNADIRSPGEPLFGAPAVE